MTVRPEPRGRPLPDLASEIRHDIEAADKHWQSAVDHAIRAGEGLIEAKAQLKHGEWLPWLGANVPGCSARSAQGYMRLARHKAESARLAYLGVHGALRQLASPSPSKVAEPPDDDDHLAWALFHLAEIERISRERAQRCLSIAERADGPLPGLARAARRYGYLLLADPDGSELGIAQQEAFDDLGLAVAEAEAV